MEMPILREIVEDAAETITVTIPLELRHRRVEVIVLPLDHSMTTTSSAQVDARGWPLGFFEATFGSLPELLDRAVQGDFETREPIE